MVLTLDERSDPIRSSATRERRCRTVDHDLHTTALDREIAEPPGGPVFARRDGMQAWAEARVVEDVGYGHGIGCRPAARAEGGGLDREAVASGLADIQCGRVRVRRPDDVGAGDWRRRVGAVEARVFRDEMDLAGIRGRGRHRDRCVEEALARRRDVDPDRWLGTERRRRGCRRRGGCRRRCRGGGRDGRGRGRESDDHLPRPALAQAAGIDDAALEAVAGVLRAHPAAEGARGVGVARAAGPRGL